MKQPMVSIILVTYNSISYLRQCLNSLKKISYRPLELVVVDNNSTDNSVAITVRTVKGWPYPIRIIKNHDNLGYAAASNIGIKRARGTLVFVLNPDTQVNPDFLQPLVITMTANRQISACQPTVYLLRNRKKLNLTGKITHYLGFDWLRNYLASRGLVIDIIKSHRHQPHSINPQSNNRGGGKSSQAPQISDQRQLTSFSGCGVLLRKKVWQQLGGFDDYYFTYYEDSDLSWRMRLAGFLIEYVPDSTIFHDYKFYPVKDYQSFQQKFYYGERN